jgi:homocysteine S-methyltransferase
VKSWLELGAEIVGGCCEIGPAHIKAISAYLAREGITTSRNIGS